MPHQIVVGSLLYICSWVTPLHLQLGHSSTFAVGSLLHICSWVTPLHLQLGHSSTFEQCSFADDAFVQSFTQCHSLILIEPRSVS